MIYTLLRYLKIHVYFAHPCVQPCLTQDTGIVFDIGDKHIGILVDDVIGQQQVVIKSLENNYKSVPGLTGATVLGDGSVALILDVLGLAAQHKETGNRATTA